MLSYTVLQGNPGISKNKGKLTETLFQTMDLENFASARRPSNLLDKAGRSGNKLDRRQSTELTIPATVDG